MTNDPASREIVEECRHGLLAMEGSLDGAAVAESLWQVCVKFSARWNYDPNGTLTKRNEELQRRVAHLQAQSLRESAQLHIHIRKIEKRFSELQAHAQELEKSSLMGPAMTRHRSSVKPAGSSASSVKTTRTAMGSVGIAGAGSTGHSFSPGGRVSRANTGEGDAGGLRRPTVPNLLESSGGGPGGLMAAADTTGSFVGSGRGLQAPPPLLAAPGGGFEPMPRLEDDECIRYSVVPAQLEEMDHEIFEPILSFDKDQQELMVDLVNEKVRRILTLDPSKWQNGRLPFGLRPDDVTPEMANLEAQLASLKGLLKDANDEIAELKGEVLSLSGQLGSRRNASKHHVRAHGAAAATKDHEKSPRAAEHRRSRGQLEMQQEGDDREGNDDQAASPARDRSRSQSPSPRPSPGRGNGRLSPSPRAGDVSDDELASGQMSPTTAAAFAGMTEEEQKLHMRIKELENMLKKLEKKGQDGATSDIASSKRALELATEALMRQSQVMHKVLKQVSAVVAVSRTVKEQKADAMMKKMGQAAEAAGTLLPIAPDSYDWRDTPPDGSASRSRGRPSPAPKAKRGARPGDGERSPGGRPAAASSGAPQGAAAHAAHGHAAGAAEGARGGSSPAGSSPGGPRGRAAAQQALGTAPLQAQAQELQGSAAAGRKERQSEPEAEPTSQHPRAQPAPGQALASAQLRGSMPELMSDLSAEERLMYRSGSSFFGSRPVSGGGSAFDGSPSMSMRGSISGLRRFSRPPSAGYDRFHGVTSEPSPGRASLRRRRAPAEPGEGGVARFHSGTQTDPWNPGESPSPRARFVG
ncbi:unnamed protein product, partial [Prorocentrum cordatum]